MTEEIANEIRAALRALSRIAKARPELKNHGAFTALDDRLKTAMGLLEEPSKLKQCLAVAESLLEQLIALDNELAMDSDFRSLSAAIGSAIESL